MLKLHMCISAYQRKQNDQNKTLLNPFSNQCLVDGYIDTIPGPIGGLIYNTSYVKSIKSQGCPSSDNVKRCHKTWILGVMLKGRNNCSHNIPVWLKQLLTELTWHCLLHGLYFQKLNNA